MRSFRSYEEAQQSITIDTCTRLQRLLSLCEVTRSYQICLGVFVTDPGQTFAHHEVSGHHELSEPLNMLIALVLYYVIAHENATRASICVKYVRTAQVSSRSKWFPARMSSPGVIYACLVMLISESRLTRGGRKGALMQASKGLSMVVAVVTSIASAFMSTVAVHRCEDGHTWSR